MKHLLTIIIFPLLFLTLTPTVSAANFQISPATSSVNVGDTITLTVSIDTKDQSTNGADTVLGFSSRLLEITSLTFNGPYTHNFNSSTASEIRTSSVFTHPADSFTGTSPLYTVTFKALTAGNTTLSLSCSADTSTDSNIWQQTTGEDIIDCALLNSAQITLTTPQTPDPPQDEPQDNNNPPANNDQNSDSGNNSNDTTKYCPTPPNPTNVRSAPHGTTSMLISWDRVADTSHYSLSYGTSAGSYVHGISNMGSTGSFLVNYLKPRTTYYFAVKSINDCGGASSGATTQNTTGGTTSSTGTSNTKTTTPLPKNTVTTSTLAQVSRPESPSGVSLAELFDDSVTPTPTPVPAPETTTFEEPQTQFQWMTLVKIFVFLFPIVALGLLIWFLLHKKTTPPLDDSPPKLEITENIFPTTPPSDLKPKSTDPHLDNLASLEKVSSLISTSKSESPDHQAKGVNYDPVTASELTKTQIKTDK